MDEKKKKIILVLLLVLLVAGGTVTGIKLAKRNAPAVGPDPIIDPVNPVNPVDPSPGPDVPDPSGGDTDPVEPADNSGGSGSVSAGNIAIQGMERLVLPSGQLKAEVELVNPQENRNRYSLSFELRLAETGEVIFSTGYIKGGKTITSVDLVRELEPGTYKAVLRVQPKDSSGRLTNNADIELDLIVR